MKRACWQSKEIHFYKLSESGCAHQARPLSGMEGRLVLSAKCFGMEGKMRKLILDINSPLWRFMGFLGDLVCVNLLFLLTAVPVVTAGASVTAMNAVFFKLREKKDNGLVRDYFRAFAGNFWKSTVIWLLYLVFLAVCVLNFNAVFNTAFPQKKAVMVLLGAVIFLLSAAVLYSLAMLARFDNDLKDTVSKAFVISILCFPYTIVMMLLMGAGFLISIESLLHLLYAFAFWFLIGFGLVGYLCSGLFLRAFRRFTRREDLEDVMPGEQEEQ